MIRALLAALLAGCTFVGGIAGGSVAAHRNHREKVEGSTSVMPGVLTGASLGMLLDAIAIGFLIHRD